MRPRHRTAPSCSRARAPPRAPRGAHTPRHPGPHAGPQLPRPPRLLEPHVTRVAALGLALPCALPLGPCRVVCRPVAGPLLPSLFASQRRREAAYKRVPLPSSRAPTPLPPPRASAGAIGATAAKLLLPLASGAAQPPRLSPRTPRARAVVYCPGRVATSLKDGLQQPPPSELTCDLSAPTPATNRSYVIPRPHSTPRLRPLAPRVTLQDLDSLQGVICQLRAYV
jgi:hypothetical protein